MIYLALLFALPTKRQTSQRQSALQQKHTSARLSRVDTNSLLNLTKRKQVRDVARAVEEYGTQFSNSFGLSAISTKTYLKELDTGVTNLLLSHFPHLNFKYIMERLSTLRTSLPEPGHKDFQGSFDGKLRELIRDFQVQNK